MKSKPMVTPYTTLLGENTPLLGIHPYETRVPYTPLLSIMFMLGGNPWPNLVPKKRIGIFAGVCRFKQDGNVSSRRYI